MAHFAQIDENNIVTQVIVVNNLELIDDDGNESEAKGIAFCKSIFDGEFVQTSYNKSYRKNYAGVGFTYDSTRDAFIAPKPYESWSLNEDTCIWEAPVPKPEPMIDYYHEWNEEDQAWDAVFVK
jgi:hypothetical protein